MARGQRRHSPDVLHDCAKQGELERLPPRLGQLARVGVCQLADVGVGPRLCADQHAQDLVGLIRVPKGLRQGVVAHDLHDLFGVLPGDNAPPSDGVGRSGSRRGVRLVQHARQLAWLALLAGDELAHQDRILELVYVFGGKPEAGRHPLELLDIRIALALAVRQLKAHSPRVATQHDAPDGHN